MALTSAAGAQTVSSTYNDNSVLTIPAGNPAGAVDTFNVSGLAGSITDVQLTLNITGGFNGALYAYLTGPLGQTTILLNRVGVTGSNPYGYNDLGMNITLSDQGAYNIHDYGSVAGYSLNGTIWAPDGRNIDPQTPGGLLYAAPTTSDFSLFNNTSPNGTWTLFIANVVAGGSPADLDSASLTITDIPEPSGMLLGASGLIALALVRRFRGK